MSRIATLRSVLHKALNKIGTTNSQVCPPGGSNVDPLLHELLVASDSYRVFDRRRKEALEAVKGQVDLDELTKMEDRVRKTDVGSDLIVHRGTHYMLHCTIKRPSKRINRAELRKQLQLQFDLSDAEAMDFISSVEKPDAPSKTFTVIEAEDQDDG